MAFKPVVHKCEVSDGDESVPMFVREPSGREILTLAAQAKKGQDKTALENARELFSRYVVHEDGSKLDDGEVEDMLNWRLTAMHRASELVQEKIGLKALTEKNA